MSEAETRAAVWYSLWLAMMCFTMIACCYLLG